MVGEDARTGANALGTGFVIPQGSDAPTLSREVYRSVLADIDRFELRSGVEMLRIGSIYSVRRWSERYHLRWSSGTRNREGSGEEVCSTVVEAEPEAWQPGRRV